VVLKHFFPTRSNGFAMDSPFGGEQTRECPGFGKRSIFSSEKRVFRLRKRSVILTGAIYADSRASFRTRLRHKLCASLLKTFAVSERRRIGVIGPRIGDLSANRLKSVSFGRARPSVMHHGPLNGREPMGKSIPSGGTELFGTTCDAVFPAFPWEDSSTLRHSKSGPFPRKAPLTFQDQSHVRRCLSWSRISRHC